VSKTCATTTGECGVAYEVRYPMPTPGRDQPWYSFDYGSVHFVFMSSEHNFTIGATFTPAPVYSSLEAAVDSPDECGCVCRVCAVCVVCVVCAHYRRNAVAVD
jgi:hypothetical protein